MIGEKLQKILDIKEDIRDAINSKGGEIMEETPFVEYASIVRELETGGGSGVELPELPEMHSFEIKDDNISMLLRCDRFNENVELYNGNTLLNVYPINVVNDTSASIGPGTDCVFNLNYVDKINLLDFPDGDYTLKARTIGGLRPSPFTPSLDYSCYTVTTRIDDKTHNERGTSFKQNTYNLYTDTFIVGNPSFDFSYELANPNWEPMYGWTPTFILDKGYYTLKEKYNLGMEYIAVAKVSFSCNSEQNLKVKYRVDRSADLDFDPVAWIWTNKYVGFGFGALDVDPEFSREDAWSVDGHFMENPFAYVFTTTNVWSFWDNENGRESFTFQGEGNMDPFLYRTDYEVDYGTVSPGEHFFYIVNYKNQSWGEQEDFLFDFKFQVQQDYMDNGYKLPDSINVTVNGAPTSDYIYDSTTGEFTIKLTGTTEVSFNSVAK